MVYKQFVALKIQYLFNKFVVKAKFTKHSIELNEDKKYKYNSGQLIFNKDYL